VVGALAGYKYLAPGRGGPAGKGAAAGPPI
jgi:hypothetical protein